VEGRTEGQRDGLREEGTEDGGEYELLYINKPPFGVVDHGLQRSVDDIFHLAFIISLENNKFGRRRGEKKNQSLGSQKKKKYRTEPTGKKLREIAQ
jgi:hypothetical protein